MATFDLRATQAFPEGTTIGAYPSYQWHVTDTPPIGPPVGSPGESQTLTGGVASFVALIDDTLYYFGAQVGAVWKYVAGRTRRTSGLSQVFPPVLGTGWSNFGGARHSAGYYTASGKVYLTGTVVASASNTTGVVFTLPNGYRPSAQVGFPASSSTGAQEINVKADGTVLAATGAIASLSLDGVQFLAEG